MKNKIHSQWQISPCWLVAMLLVLTLTAFLLSPGLLMFKSLFTPNTIKQFLWLAIMYLFLIMILQNNPPLAIFSSLAGGQPF